MSDAPVKHLAIIGIGLIGSSLARAAAEYGAAEVVSLYDAVSDVRQRAGDLNIGQVHKTLSAAVSEADLIILCTPVGVMGDIVQNFASAIQDNAIISDVGSVKQSVFDAVSEHVPANVHFIAGHPIAGTEKSGPEAGFATLFQNRWCILTPPNDLTEGGKSALATLSAFWTKIGSRVEIMEPDQHDRVLAITSHLPHLIAFNIVGTAHDLESVNDSDVIKFSAGGFRDFTRIAASDPIMWRDVFLNNKEAVLEMLGRFNEDLSALQRAIRWGEGEHLRAFFERTRGIRQSIIDAGQDTDAPNFGRDESE